MPPRWHFGNIAETIEFLWFFYGFSRSGTPQIVALACLVVIFVALGAYFLKVDCQSDFDKGPDRRDPSKWKVIPAGPDRRDPNKWKEFPASWPPVTDMPEQTWDWTTEDLGLGTAMLQDIWTWDCRTFGLYIALCPSQPGGPKGPADMISVII